MLYRGILVRLYLSLIYEDIWTAKSHKCTVRSDFILSVSDQISALSKSCYYHIRELRCLRSCLDFKTASTIATSIVHSKLDYCNLLYYNLPQSQIKNSRTSRTLLLVLSPERQNLLTSLLF